MLVVPGSQQVKRQAEAEGLDRVFLDGRRGVARVRAARCASGMNGDLVPRGEYAVSTSNRNFEGRQGAGARTLLASPAHRRRERGHAAASPTRASCCRRGKAMQAFTRLTSRTVVLPAANIDTDQIIPARFLTTTTREGLGAAAVRRLAL